MKTIRQKLESRGFAMGQTFGGKTFFGTKAAEKIDTGKNHFQPRNRHVYVSNRMGGKGYGDGTVPVFYYVTSDITGKMRRYRCRHIEDINLKNIYASGRTQHEAVDNWLHNFDNGIYNES